MSNYIFPTIECSYAINSYHFESLNNPKIDFVRITMLKLCITSKYQFKIDNGRADTNISLSHCAYIHTTCKHLYAHTIKNVYYTYMKMQFVVHLWCCLRIKIILNTFSHDEKNNARKD